MSASTDPGHWRKKAAEFRWHACQAPRPEAARLRQRAEEFDAIAFALQASIAEAQEGARSPGASPWRLLAGMGCLCAMILTGTTLMWLGRGEAPSPTLLAATPTAARPVEPEPATAASQVADPAADAPAEPAPQAAAPEPGERTAAATEPTPPASIAPPAATVAAAAAPAPRPPAEPAPAASVVEVAAPVAPPVAEILPNDVAGTSTLPVKPASVRGRIGPSQSSLAPKPRRAAADFVVDPTGGRSCRPYTSTTSVLGLDVPVQGIACRLPDGRWSLVSEVPMARGR